MGFEMRPLRVQITYLPRKMLNPLLRVLAPPRFILFQP